MTRSTRTKHASSGGWLRWLVAVLLLALPTQRAVAATVRGSIVHHSGQPGRYVAVRVAPAQGQPSPFVNSGGNGWYYISGVAAGEYTLEVWVNERDVVKASVSVSEPVTDVPQLEIP